MEDSEVILFLGVPVVRSLAELAEKGLSPEDWPLHDATGDYLQLLQSKDTALSGVRQMVADLVRERGELRSTVEALTEAARARDRAHASLEGQEMTLQAIVDTALDAVITIDKDSRILGWNTPAQTMFGWPAAEAVGRSLADTIIPLRFREAHARGLARYLATGEGPVLNRRIELFALHRDGHEFPTELAVSPVRWGEEPLFCAFIRDISDRKRREHLLRTQFDVARLLVGAESLGVAAPAVLSATSGLIGFEFAGLWTRRPGEMELRCVDVWHDPQDAGLAPFAEVSRRTRLAAGAGLPGRVLSEDGVVWWSRLEAGDSHSRAHDAAASGLSAGVALPIRARGGVEGVLEYFSRRAGRPDEETVLAMQTLATQIGQFIERRRGEAELLASERRLSRTLAAVRAGMWSTNLLTGRSYWSDANYRMLGYEVGSVEPGVDRFMERVHPEDRQRLESLNADAPDGALMDVEYRILRLGEERWLRNLAHVERDGAGRPIEVSGITLDVTDAHAAAEERALLLATQHESDARMRAVIENMLEGLLLVTEDLQILHTNPACESIFGYGAGELEGLALARLLPERPEYQKGLLERYRRSIGSAMEWEGRRKDGSLLPMEIHAYDAATASGTFHAIHVRDLSGQHAADRLKKQFVASVSHELRTPLTAIRGALGLLQLGAAGPLAVPAAELVQVAQRNGERLMAIIEDILDFERLQNGLMSVVMARVDLDPVITRAIESAAALARDARVAVGSVETGLSVRADAARVEQVIVNLVSNAVKFSPKGASVGIDGITLADGRIEVRVSDQGRGVPEAQRELIFEPFRQTEASDARRHGGAGLGLAICRALVREQGGEIGVRDRVGGGSVFWFTLQPAPAEAPPPPPEGPPVR